jgi:dimethylamine/trimethylamine dehydrogenase
VTLAEATRNLGGRVHQEARLPGLAEWGRVRDWRVTQLDKLSNVEVYRESLLNAEQVLEFGFAHVAIATGARWRKDGYGRMNNDPIVGSTDAANVYSPDDLMAGATPPGPVVVFDDDHYYMGNVLAEKLRESGVAVTLVTPAAEISAYSHYTLEFERIIARMAERGVETITSHNLAAIGSDEVTIAHIHSGVQTTLDAVSVVLVTAREPNDTLYKELNARPEELQAAGIRSVTAMGDCYAPSAIVHAVYAGHRYAQELDVPESERLFRRDRPAVGQIERHDVS